MDEQSQVNSPMLATKFAEPMTFVSANHLLRGMVDMTRANSIYLKNNIMQPGIWRFLRFWASPFSNSSSSKLDKTKIMLQLLEQNSKILSELTEEGIIHKEAVKKAKLTKLEHLEGIDTNKECEAYLERNKDILALQGATTFHGKKALDKNLSDRFPAYTGLRKNYNMATEYDQLQIDTPQIMKDLLEYVKQQKNVEIVLDSEITAIERDDRIKGNVGIIRTGYGGSKTSRSFVCDCVVFCNGGQVS